MRRRQLRVDREAARSRPDRVPTGWIIPFSRLETDLETTLNECAESGQTMVVELRDRRLLAIQSLDPQGDDTLIDELIASNPGFRDLVAKSKAGPRKPFSG